MRYRHTLAALVAVLALISAAVPALRAQVGSGAPPETSGRATLEAGSRGGEIEIDGRLDEDAWREAPTATGFVQRSPEPGADASDSTRVRVLRGDDALYVGARLSGDPDSISARLARRDSRDVQSDWFGVLLDSDDDNRSAFGFEANPLGLERDFILRESGSRDLTWNAVWDVEARIDSAGWTAEFRLPLSQLRYSPDEARWGVNFRREVARRDEVAYWAPVPPDDAGTVSRFGTLEGLSEVEATSRLEVQPYTASRLDRRGSVDSGNPFESANELEANAGLDLEYGLTSDLSLSATFNPDFGQVEADPSRVNLTEFETFFPEKRPFFLEGADVFDFRMYPAGRLFYSRRIGRAPQGRVPGDAVYRDKPDRTTIMGAAKVSGKTADGWSVGVLDAVTAPERAHYVTGDGDGRRTAMVEPMTNYGVARLSRDFRDGESSVGGIFTATNRRLEKGDGLSFLRSAAYTGGVDARHRFLDGSWEIRGEAVGSHVRGSREAIARTQREPERYLQRPDAGHVDFDSTRTTLSGMAAHLRLEKLDGHWRGGLVGGAVTPGFEMDDLGFQRRADQLNFGGYFGYTQYEPGRHFRRWRLNAGANGASTFGGEPLQRSVFATASAQLHGLWSGSLHVRRRGEALSTSALRGGPAIVRPASNRLYARLRGDPRQAVHPRLSLNGSLEEGTDGWSFGVEPGLELRPSSRLQVSLDTRFSWRHEAWQFVSRESVDGRRRYVFSGLDRATTSLTARLSYALTPDLSVEFYGQPFLSTGDYSGFMEVRDPDAATFESRFRRLGADELTRDEERGRYRWSPEGDGSSEAGWRNPDFNLAQFRSNLVLRWEYRPGSTLFVAWNLGRTDARRDPSYDLGGALDRLVDTGGPGVLLVKASYWLDL